MNRTKIFLRANGNNSIGLGHIMRLESIEMMLKNHFECIYILREEDIEAISILKTKIIIKIPIQNDILAESNWIATNCLTGKELVVLDGYNFNTEYQNNLKANCLKMIFIDDIQNYHYVADLIINHSEGITKDRFSVESYSKLLLGINYCILRPDFLNQARNNKKKIPNGNVLVCMGGADPDNITLHILNEILPKWSSYQINVILGGANSNINSISSFAKDFQNIKIYQNLNASEIAHIMNISSIAILPPSTVSLEYLCSGGSLYTYKIADNQTSINNMLIEGGFARPYNSIRSKFQNSPHFDCKIKLIDGLSSERILKEFVALSN
jgi:UDP-2,4-diacetamido-2,4,6-trideoxy-beta-L-altropyranose hydrolase